jgi:hypothetical protein
MKSFVSSPPEAVNSSSPHRYILLALFLSICFCQAQNNFTCGFDTVHSGTYQSDTIYSNYIDNLRTFIKDYIDGNQPQLNPAPFTIPVTVTPRSLM